MKIFVLGDSTAASYTQEMYPQTGWGQVLNEYLPEGIEVINTAKAGRSTKSFIAEGRLVEIEKQISAGDIMLIQFTHNDMSDLVWRHTDVWTGFMTCLSVFINTARLHGAEPVLLTPIPQRNYEDGKLVDSLGEYPAAVRKMALDKGTKLFDVYAEALKKLRLMSEDETRSFYMNIDKGVYANIPDGRIDNTHTQEAGARFYAGIVSEMLKTSGLLNNI